MRFQYICNIHIHITIKLANKTHPKYLRLHANWANEIQGKSSFRFRSFPSHELDFRRTEHIQLYHSLPTGYSPRALMPAVLSLLVLPEGVWKALYRAHPPPGTLQSANVFMPPIRRVGGLGGPPPPR